MFRISKYFRKKAKPLNLILSPTKQQNYLGNISAHEKVLQFQKYPSRKIIPLKDQRCLVRDTSLG
jgi:hypothetical protein